MDDADVMFHIKQWQKSDDKILVGFIESFSKSQTFQDFRPRYAGKRTAEFLDKARKLVENAGFDPNYYFIEDRAGDVPYYFYTKNDTRTEKSDLRRRRFFASAN